jgi:hypothetical protein
MAGTAAKDSRSVRETGTEEVEAEEYRRRERRRRAA